jgi:hypothetical protein
VYENEKQKVEIQTGFYSSQQVGTDGGLFRGVLSTLKTCRSDRLHLAEAVKSRNFVEQDDIRREVRHSQQLVEERARVAERVNISGPGIHKLVHRI